MAEIEFLGAAKEVTGSKHLIHTQQGDILLDCGLFQGSRKEAAAKNRGMNIDVKKLRAVILSHAHIDHSGSLPLLYKKGYRGPIYTTPASRDLCSPMLMDTAHILKSDAEHIAKMIARGRKVDPVEPLFDEDDVRGVLSLMISIPYRSCHDLFPGSRVCFYDAGHVLGSAISVLDIEENGKTYKLAFTGDLGRPHLPILNSPEIPEGVTHLLMESTYGDRLHDPIEQVGDQLAEIINKTYKRGGKIVIPSFALERAQEIIYTLKKLISADKIPALPVYVDSPLAIKLTEIFKLHPECYDKETFALLQGNDSPFDFPSLTYTASVEDSKKIGEEQTPSIIISASGMCEAGRILHHLMNTVGDSKNSILIVGFQAVHTLGRRIVEKAPEIKIFGESYPLKAEVHVLNGFSAHADQKGLIDFTLGVKAKGDLKKIILVHGEESAQKVLQEKLIASGFSDVEIPGLGDSINI